MTALSRSVINGFAEQVSLKLLGVVGLGKEPDYDYFQEWIKQGNHGGMSFLENYREVRQDSSSIYPDARSAVIFALPYYLGDRSRSSKPMIAQYARIRDYHKMLKKKGEYILSSMKKINPDLTGKVVVDSAPLMERSLASRTVRGFIGKNTLYIHPELGSFLLLGEIVTTQPIALDLPANVDSKTRTPDGGCGTCKRCQINCPTGALDNEWKMDARKCISYWTIEHRGTIPVKYWQYLGRYWYGCDICQLVCPWNRKIPNSEFFQKETEVNKLDLFDVAIMDQNFYESSFGGTPMTRAKIHGLRRNALIAMTVTEHPRLMEAINAVQNSDYQVIRDTVKQIDQWRLEY